MQCRCRLFWEGFYFPEHVLVAFRAREESSLTFNKDLRGDFENTE